MRPDPEYFNDDLDEQWNMRYLPTIVDPVDDESVYHSWLWFVLSKGFRYVIRLGIKWRVVSGLHGKFASGSCFSSIVAVCAFYL